MKTAGSHSAFGVKVQSTHETIAFDADRRTLRVAPSAVDNFVGELELPVLILRLTH